MFKKKGGLAFKPKIPSARPRPAAPAAPVAVAKTVAVTNDVTIEQSSAVVSSSPPTREKYGESISSVSLATPDSSRPSPPAAPESTGISATNATLNLTSRPPVPAESANTTIALVASNDNGNQSVDLPNTPPPTLPSTLDHIERLSELDNATRPGAHTTTAPESRNGQQASQQPFIALINGIESATNIDNQYTPQPAIADVASAALPTPQSTPAVAPKPKPRSRKKAPTAAQTADGDGATVEPPKKRQRKAPSNGDEAATPKPPRKRKTPAKDAEGNNQARARRARSMTPEDSEAQMVDLQKLKMTDLTKDLHIGKKFSRHDELRDRERQSRLKAKLKSTEATGSGSETPPPPDAENTSNGNSKSTTPAAASSSTAAAAAAAAPAPAGPQFRIVDGQIVVDQNSLQMDRHARAAAAHAGQDMETIEENDFTRLITSNSFMNTSKLKGPNIWTEDETELFYRGLRMFGTEFEMISKMFPGKQRRHVKLKFNREERHCPQRIDAALIGEKTIKMDIEEYKAFTGIEFESVESIEAEQRKIAETYEAERQRVADEQAEIMRKKREELFADDDGNEDGASRKKKRGKKKGKDTVQYGLNGEPIGLDS